jgi:hypothetical protein
MVDNYPALHTAIDTILDAVDILLKAEIKTDGLLEGVQQCGRMSYEMPSPPFPGIWYYAGTMKPVRTNTGERERWVMPIVLASLTWNDDAQTGSEDATRLAAAARSVLLRTGNLRVGCVSQTVSDRFEPAAPIDRKKEMFSALAMVTVEFSSTR